MRTFTRASFVLALSLTIVAPVQAGLGSKAAGELAEFVMKKFGKEVAGEGAEKLAGKLTAAAARHGDDVIAAVRKVGPKALGLADEAGENAPRVIRFLTRHGDDGLRVLSHPQGMALFSRFGDDAAEVLLRHHGAAAPVLERLGEPAVKALGAVGPQAGRRMAILAGDLAGSGRAPELMGVITRYGDPAMEFIWKNKGILAGGAALVAFLADPEPYLNGTANITRVVAEGAGDITRVVSENAVKPAVIAAGNVAVEAASFVRQLLIAAFVGLAVILGLAFKSGVLKQTPARLALKLAGKHLGEQVVAGVRKRE